MARDLDGVDEFVDRARTLAEGADVVSATDTRRRVTRRRRPATPRGLCSDCGQPFERFAVHGLGNRWRFCLDCYRTWHSNQELDAEFLEAVQRDSQGKVA